MEKLSDLQFKELLLVDKYFDIDDDFYLNEKSWVRDITSFDGQQKFKLDFHRGKTQISRYTYNKRRNTSTVLARLDRNGPPHRNPDGTIIEGDHVHFYSEEYGDRLAYPLEKYGFLKEDTDSESLQKFCKLWNVKNLPLIHEHLLGGL